MKVKPRSCRQQLKEARLTASSAARKGARRSRRLSKKGCDIYSHGLSSIRTDIPNSERLRNRLDGPTVAKNQLKFASWSSDGSMEPPPGKDS